MARRDRQVKQLWSRSTIKPNDRHLPRYLPGKFTGKDCDGEVVETNNRQLTNALTRCSNFIRAEGNER